jgi:hypothetical protein
MGRETAPGLEIIGFIMVYQGVDQVDKSNFRVTSREISSFDGVTMQFKVRSSDTEYTAKFNLPDGTYTIGKPVDPADLITVQSRISFWGGFFDAPLTLDKELNIVSVGEASNIWQWTLQRKD